MFDSGGAVDLVFPYSGQAAKNYTTNRYNNGAGQFKANYFKTDLKSRGLIDYCHGPRIKNFPFYQDAGVINDAIHTFMTSFVKSYYSSDSEVASDQEIQAWVEECNGAAQVFDFPSEISSIDTLINVLTHVVSCLFNFEVRTRLLILARRIWSHRHITQSTRTNFFKSRAHCHSVHHRSIALRRRKRAQTQTSSSSYHPWKK